MGKKLTHTEQAKIRDKLSDFIEAHRISVNQFAVATGINQSQLSKILKGKATITTKTIEKICGTYDIELDEFLDNTLITDRGASRPHIPLTVHAGTLSGIGQSAGLSDCEMRPIIGALPDYDFTISIVGDSMLPYFIGGDDIAIKRINSFIEWGKVYVLDTRDGIVIKRLYDAGENFRCVSYNKEYADFFVCKNDVFAVFRIVGQIRVFR